MKRIALLAATALFTLSACGGGASEEASDNPDDAAADTAAPDAATTPGADAAATPAADATTAAAPTAAPSANASPTPAASASTAAAAPAVAAAPMAPPASFTTCGVCHSVASGQNGIGPSLAGVVGRRSGTVAGYAYSQGAKDTHVVWNEATLDRYLADPSAVVAGTTMPPPGLTPAQRREVIAYLKSL